VHAFLLSHEAKHVCEVAQGRDGRYQCHLQKLIVGQKTDEP
jgi:hypothetical protein